MRFAKGFALVLPGALLAMSSGCAHLHHVEIGDIDCSQGPLRRIEVKESATGVNVEEAANLAKALSRSREVEHVANGVSDLWKLITYGPKTGEVTFTDSYADTLPEELVAACPSHRITGVTAIRETNKYPVISGEIVRVTAFCVSPRSPR